jgi:hypothetical protein
MTIQTHYLEQGLILNFGMVLAMPAGGAMRKNTVLGLVVAALVVIGGWTAVARNNNNVATPSPSPTIAANVPQDVSATKVATFKGVEGEIALATLKKNFTVETKEYAGMGEYVTVINGLAADAANYWAFYINGKMADVGAGSYTAKAGDTFEFRLTAI